MTKPFTPCRVPLARSSPSSRSALLFRALAALLLLLSVTLVSCNPDRPPDIPAALPLAGSNSGLPVVESAPPTTLPSLTPTLAWTATVANKVRTPSATPSTTPSLTPTQSPTVASTATVVPATATPSVTFTATPLPTQTATLPPTPTPVHAAASSPPTRIQIPSINVDTKVLEIFWTTYVDHHGATVTGWKVADYAAGWHHGSAYPGQPSNVVISGHNNFRGEVFRNLYKVQPGQDVYVYVGNVAYRYVIREVFMVKESDEPDEVRFENAKWIAPTEQEQLTLVSCWPYLTATHRVLVLCDPVPLEKEGKKTN